MFSPLLKTLSQNIVAKRWQTKKKIELRHYVALTQDVVVVDN